MFTSPRRPQTRRLVGAWLVVAVILSGPIASARWTAGEHATPEQWAQHVLLEAFAIRHHACGHDPTAAGDAPVDALAGEANSAGGAVVMMSPDVVGTPFPTVDFGQLMLASLLLLWFAARVRGYHPITMGVGAAGPLPPPPRQVG